MDFLKKFNENIHIFNELNNVEGYRCGSYLCDGTNYQYCDLMLEKQKLLFQKAKTAVNVLEVGVYRAHSAFIMLLANPDIKITCIDIDDTLSKPCTDILNKHFNNNILFIKGDSKDILSKLPKIYDLFHLDGEHLNETVETEFFKILQLNKNQKFINVIFDDWLCCEKLINDISNNEKYEIIERIEPHSAWGNLFLAVKY